MSKLYELTADFMQLLEMLEDEQCEEQVIIDTLESVNYDIEQKAENYAKIIKSMEGHISNIINEIERLQKRKKTFESRTKWLKLNLENCMRATGKTKFTTALFSFNIQKNGGKRSLTIDVDLDKIPQDYRIQQPDKINEEKLRQYLKEKGVVTENGLLCCEWCHLEPPTESLRIK